ncbi:hypothetical protein GCM10027063_49750 [Promicromonospora xylanilytica]
MSKIRREPRTAPRGWCVAPLLAVTLALTGCTAGSDQASGDRTAPATASADPRDAEPRDAGPEPGSPGTARPRSAEPRTSEPSTAEPGSAGPHAPVPDGRSGGQSGGEGSEVAPPGPEGRPTGDRLGDVRVPSAGRLSRTQETGDATGLVRGFPDDVVLVPAGAEVASSSVTGTDGRYQVALDAVVEGACADVLLDYRAWFTTGGFAETGTTSRPGRTTVELERNDETAQVGAARDPAGCAVTVFAVLSVR